MKSKPNVGQILMATHLKELGLGFCEQFKFHQDRKWLLDFYLPEYAIGIEIDGYFAGKHGAGYGSDNEKQNTATMSGIRMLRFSTNAVKRGEAKQFLSEWLSNGHSPGTGRRQDARKDAGREKGRTTDGSPPFRG